MPFSDQSLIAFYSATMGTNVDPIKSILFEKQVARLCAQHALNMLLQEQLFSAAELAEIAGKLDREENEVLEAGHRESQNMDDTGFFSVQVMSEALKIKNLDLISINHPGVKEIRENPLLARAFICNRSEHWFVIRKFGQQWFELNSCRAEPLLHTDTYVSLFLTQLTNDGYSIFVVNGILPDCVAEHVIAANPVKFVPPKRKEKEKEEEKKEEPKVKAFSGTGARLGDSTAPPAAPVAVIDISDEDDEMEEAIRRSLADQEAAELAAIVELSLREFHSNQAGPSGSSAGVGGGKRARTSSEDDLQRAIAMSTEDDSEERSFQMALAMSMEAEPSTSTASRAAPKMTDAEEARAKREAFLKRLG